MMVSRPRSLRNPSMQSTPSGQLGWLDTFLEQTYNADIWLKPLVTDFDYAHERYRLYGVLLTSLIMHPGAPILYATFRAATVKLGSRAILPFPSNGTEILLNRFKNDVFACAEHLRSELYASLFQTIWTLDHTRILVPEAQWDIPDPWRGLAKGMEWRDGAWVYVKGPERPSNEVPGQQTP